MIRGIAKRFVTYAIYTLLLELLLPIEPSCPSVGWLVGLSFRWHVSYTSKAPIGALVPIIPIVFGWLGFPKLINHVGSRQGNPSDLLQQ